MKQATPDAFAREMGWTPPFFSPHIVGALVALSIAALAKVTPTMPGIALERLIRGLAGASFGLYLLYYPC